MSETIFVPTERDLKILHLLNRCRFARTGHVWQHVFPEKKERRVPNKRLKTLCEKGFISYREPQQEGSGKKEYIYYLTPQGASYLSDSGEQILLYSEARNKNYPWYLHALRITDFYIHLHKSAQHLAKDLVLKRYMNEFEIRSNARKNEGVSGRKLFFKLQGQGKNYEVVPDALFILEETESKERMMYCVEVDRSSETWKILKDKLLGYNIARQQNVFKKFGASHFHILFQCESEQRAQNIHQVFQGMENNRYVWTTSIGKIQKNDVLHAPIWKNFEGKHLSILAE